MKKTAIISLLLIALSSCRQSGVDEVSLNAEQQPVTIAGHISAAASRTTIDSDGRIVLWAEGDTIGLFGTSSKHRNVNARLIDSYAGSEDGLFSTTSNMTPKYAYFPYKPAASTTSSTINLSLPVSQSPVEGKPDMRYDVKVASSISGSRQEGYSAVFVQKMALLHFVFTPDSQLAGDKITGISISDTAAVLAGDYTLNLADAAKPLTFTSGSNLAAIKFSGYTVLAEGVPVEGWLFVNPDVKKGDELTINVRTSAHSATIKVTAAKDFEAGYRYRMPLDMAYLSSKGKVEIKDKSADAEILALTTPGIYDIQSHSYKCEYVPQTCQYSTFSADGKYNFRILSFIEGWAVRIAISEPVTEGADCSVSVETVGNAPVQPGNYAAEIIQLSSSLVLLSASDSGLGFILSR